MKVLFDTSVLVAAAVSDLKNHETSLDCLVRYTEKKYQGICPTHALVECYAVILLRYH
jgi:predicted nucleic acid-binding protein